MRVDAAEEAETAPGAAGETKEGGMDTAGRDGDGMGGTRRNRGSESNRVGTAGRGTVTVTVISPAPTPAPDLAPPAPAPDPAPGRETGAVIKSGVTIRVAPSPHDRDVPLRSGS
jgi:hypothetical protein